MRNFLDRSCRRTPNMKVRFNNFFFENRAVYEIMWKNIVEPDRPQMTIQCLCIAWWIPKTTNTHSEYVILIACHCNIRYTKHLNVMLHIHCLSCFSGPHFRHMGLQERQEALRSQYFFTCTCRPCSLSGQQDFQVILHALDLKARRTCKVKVAS